MTYILMKRVNGEDYRDYVKSHSTDDSEIYRSLVEAVRHFWALQFSVRDDATKYLEMVIVSQLHYHENQMNTQIVKCNDNSINYT